MPEDDPRRKPTFRFDVGDVAWARAFVSFQRARVDVVARLRLVRRSTRSLRRRRRQARDRIVLRLAHPDRIAQARARILEGLDRSDEARRAYLAETDDDREWVPNPRQKSHPMPLPVDQALYDTWEGVRRRFAAARARRRGARASRISSRWTRTTSTACPAGFIDVGGMLSHPHDITLTTSRRSRRSDERRDAEALFGALLAITTSAR